MHTKSELESLSMDELTGIAHSLNVPVSANDSQIDLIYSIIGAESDLAMNAQAKPAEGAAPKKRGRKSKAEKEAEAAAKLAESSADLFANESTTVDPQSSIVNRQSSMVNDQEADKPAPKKRGRKSKAEKEAEAAAQAAELQAQESENESNASDTVQPETEDSSLSNGQSEDLEANDSSMVNVQSSMVNGQTDSFFNTDEPDFIILQDVEFDDNLEPEQPVSDETVPSSLQTLATLNEHSSNLNVQSSVVNRQSASHYDFTNIIKVEGVLEINNDGNGFLRSSDYYYMPSPDDVFVSAQQIKQYAMKTGDVVEGAVRPPRDNEHNFILTSIERVNGMEPARLRDRQVFENLTPLFPDEKFTLCSGSGDPTSVRIVDLFSPIGKGQRALIVAQPKTGKTILMKEIANAIAANHPEAYLMMLLIDERPEEVTDMARTVKAEVIASTFDEPADHHVKIANIVLEKAKRMVECGHDVVIFLDSITRLARAFNTIAPGSGKILTGGVDANALQKPKRFFGAARNIEGGGSLTIIATALIDTGSKMDEVIFEEFKGTGNMELQLDRTLANKRIFPAVNIVASSTRRDDLLHDKLTRDRMWIIRNYLSDMNPVEAMTDMKKRIEDTKNNEEFIATMSS